MIMKTRKRLEEWNLGEENVWRSYTAEYVCGRGFGSERGISVIVDGIGMN